MPPDPLWRFALAKPVRSSSGYVVTDMPILSWMDRRCAERAVTIRNNQPMEISGTVPSDDTEINRMDDDNDPFLAEGVRCVIGLRRESDSNPTYTCRANGIILQTVDEASTDLARTTWMALDGWGYLFSRLCLRPGTDRFPKETGLNTLGAPAGTVALQLLKDTIQFAGETFIDAGPAWGGTAFWGGVIQTTAGVDMNIQAGTTVGQAWADLCETGEMDIVLTPIYDPVNRPGHLWDLSIYKKRGTWRPEAVFAWDRPGRSLTGLSRTNDGSTRANRLRFHNGQGGPAGPILTDTTSVQRFGEYWDEQFFPKQQKGSAVLMIAQEYFRKVKTGREVITFDPAAGRSPDPIIDYDVGDTVTVWASDAFRKAMTSYKRVLEIPINIDDNGTESVAQVVVEEGEAPAIETSLTGTDTSSFAAEQQAVILARRRRAIRRRGLR